ncbi:hypothetical protein Y032_0335g2858 [Ancylostoma ceylanicum]|uniref:SCP domain-containing protein n=1 Tax=Ancylostoma ceylanicum TaxID=53326 RepID=A0A016RZB6_9BILA|nr:hypothetical protein Y032_0335g2858 [Ancylostoma ceylanicum]
MVPRVAEAQVGPPSCPNTQMTNILRGIFLDTHNNLRGSLARGQTERRGTSGEIAPPASLMYRMVRYELRSLVTSYQNPLRRDTTATRNPTHSNT